MTHYLITQAQEADLPDLEALLNSAFRGDTSKQGWTHEADLIQGDLRTDRGVLEEILNNPQATLLCLRHNTEGTLLGCVMLENKSGLLYLGMLSVAPQLQGQGIGKILLHAAEVHAREQNCRAIEMTVISARTELIDWYIRHGYQPTGETRPFIVPQKFGTPVFPLEFVVLEKPVS